MDRCALSWIVASLGLIAGAKQVSAAVPGNTSTPLPAKPLFSRHVVPLMTRLGCNAGTCHGAVKGQNGFRLGLFGAKPAFDHEQVTRNAAGRRINRASPDASLLLLKASTQVPHEGGQLIKPDGRDYQLLRDWIARGALLDPVEESSVTQLSVEPGVQVVKPGESYALRVQAKFADGSLEEVTS